MDGGAEATLRLSSGCRSFEIGRSCCSVDGSHSQSGHSIAQTRSDDATAGPLPYHDHGSDIHPRTIAPMELVVPHANFGEMLVFVWQDRELSRAQTC